MPKTVKDLDAERAHPSFMKRRLLMSLGVEVSTENLEHLDALLDSLVVYDARSKIYGDQWRQAGADDNLRNAARKVKRQGHQMTLTNVEGPVALRPGGDDDAVDAINYLAFFRRNLRTGNVSGTED